MVLLLSIIYSYVFRGVSYLNGLIINKNNNKILLKIPDIIGKYIDMEKFKINKNIKLKDIDIILKFKSKEYLFKLIKGI